MAQNNHYSTDEMTPLKRPRPPLDRTSSRRIPLTENAKRAQRKLQLACVCSLLFMGAEIVGGFVAGSLAIMTDAAHLLSDVAGFCISLFAIWITTLPASGRLSFGFQRAEVIGAVTSVLVIWVLTGVLVYAAVERFVECLEPNPKEHVDGKLMFIVACIGLFVNLILMQILGHGHSHGGSGHGHSHGGTTSHRSNDEKRHGHSHGKNRHAHSHGESEGHDHVHGGNSHVHPHANSGHGHSHGGHGLGDLENGPTIVSQSEEKVGNPIIQAAYIHALGDFIQSVGVCVAGGLIWYKPEWQIADPIATFIFSVLVLATTIGIVRDSVHVLMEGTPDGIHADEIEQGLRRCSSVVAVHDLHIWSLSAGLPSLSVHLVSDDAETALHAAQRYLMSKGITHTTIQIEKTATLYPRDCKSDLKCGQNSPRLSD